MAFSKTININVAPNFAGPSGDSLNLTMAFNKDAITPVPQNTAAAWKVSTVYFNKPASQFISVTYAPNLGVSSAEMSDGNIVTPGQKLAIDLGDQTTFGSEGFSAPISGVPGNIDVNIDATTLPNIAGGIFNDASPPKFMPISVWKKATNNSTVQIGFTPVLSIYSNDDYVESQLMPGVVSGLLWRYDLTNLSLPNPIVLDLIYNAQQAEFQLVPAA